MSDSHPHLSHKFDFLCKKRREERENKIPYTYSDFQVGRPLLDLSGENLSSMNKKSQIPTVCNYCEPFLHQSPGKSNCSQAVRLRAQSSYIIGLGNFVTELIKLLNPNSLLMVRIYWNI